MTDNLRDRIAAVLSQHDVNLPDKVADAVIRELIAAMGLRHEHRGWPNPERRWVSDWKADDE